MTMWDFFTVVFLFWWIRKYLLPWFKDFMKDAPRAQSK